MARMTGHLRLREKREEEEEEEEVVEVAAHIRAQHTWKTLPSSQTEEERRTEYGSHPCSSLCVCQEEEEEEEVEKEEETSTQNTS